MNNHPRSNRLHYFINEEFQGRYIFSYFLLVLIGSFIFIGVFSIFSSNTLSIVYDNYHLQLGVTPQILFKKILSIQWLLLVFGGGFVVIVTLLLTHRISGPFQKIEKNLDKMLEGDISKNVSLRRTDMGKKLVEKLNRFNHTLGDNLLLIAGDSSSVERSVLQLKKNMESPRFNIDEIESVLDEILEKQKNIKLAISDYSLPPTGQK
jgi:methyl-accepting chemotaxis protein